MAINRRNSRYLMDLAVADMDPSICISPISKAPLKADGPGGGQKCLIIFVVVGK
jgi:hypothetical protein